MDYGKGWKLVAKVQIDAGEQEEGKNVTAHGIVLHSFLIGLNEYDTGQ